MTPTPLTREQIREIDRRAIEDYGIPGVVLMENAGRNAAHIILQHPQVGGPAPVCIFCGRGNNGGDGFVIARHLVNAGSTVDIVVLGDPQKLPPDARTNHDIAVAMNIPMHTWDPPHANVLISRAAIIVDALLGTGFSGEVRPPLDEALALLNGAEQALKVAIDVPSGLDCNSGAPAATTFRADLTITFVAPKVGFARAPGYTGQVRVADIGAPRVLIEAFE